MIRDLPHAPPVDAARRLTGLIPPAAGIPVFGMTLAPPERMPDAPGRPPLLPDRLDAAMQAFAADWRDPEPRAVATQFSKYWFRAAIPPVLICAAGQRAAPNVALDALALTTDEAGIPYLVAPDDPAVGVAPADSESVMHRLMADNLEPVVAALVARSGLAPRVFWSNAGNLIAWYLASLRANTPTVDGARTVAARWVEARSHPRFDGHNPLRTPLSETPHSAGNAVPQRRICCARYLSDDLDLCPSCPLSSASAARRAKR